MELYSHIDRKYYLRYNDNFNPFKFFEKHYKMIKFIGKIPFLKDIFNCIAFGCIEYTYNLEYEYAKNIASSLAMFKTINDNASKYIALVQIRDFRERLIEIFDPEFKNHRGDYSIILSYKAYCDEPAENEYANNEYVGAIDQIINDRFGSSLDGEELQDYIESIMNLSFLFSKEFDKWLEEEFSKC